MFSPEWFAEVWADSVAELEMVKDLRHGSPGAAMEAQRTEDARFTSGCSTALGRPTRIPYSIVGLMQHSYFESSPLASILQPSDFIGKTEGIRKECSYLPGTEM